ncbi:MAG: hypothetical protein JGK31_15590 [Microcoleus sp. PH2017_30_WIL_O_A]|jgi:hypothetical protein|nr:hypothetical protein [Microcoleus sp. PH2017_30_WIL_O_A]
MTAYKLLVISHIHCGHASPLQIYFLAQAAAPPAGQPTAHKSCFLKKAISTQPKNTPPRCREGLKIPNNFAKLALKIVSYDVRSITIKKQFVVRTSVRNPAADLSPHYEP